jgi:hypothetical protein
MTAIGSVTFQGTSGSTYEFIAYPWKADFEDVSAVYFITKVVVEQDGKFYYTPIYIGKTQNLCNHFDYHAKAECIARYEGNCVCILPIEDSQHRSQIATQIKANYSLVCNDE